MHGIAIKAGKGSHWEKGKSWLSTNGNSFSKRKHWTQANNLVDDSQNAII